MTTIKEFNAILDAIDWDAPTAFPPKTKSIPPPPTQIRHCTSSLPKWPRRSRTHNSGGNLRPRFENMLTVI